MVGGAWSVEGGMMLFSAFGGGRGGGGEDWWGREGEGRPDETVWRGRADVAERQ